MRTVWNRLLCLAAVAGICAPAHATVQIKVMRPAPISPQPIGKVITYSVTATDTNPGPLAFQFNVTPPGGSSAVVVDFNLGKLSSGVWTAPAFEWWPTLCNNVPQTSGVVALTCQPVEGTYTVEVVAKDFITGETASRKNKFTVNPIVSGSTPAVKGLSNPLVALFGAPACPVGSRMRVKFQQQSQSTPAMTTNWVSCLASQTMNFEIAGMYPQTTYEMFAQTQTGSNITDGASMSFTTGAIPTKVSIPTFQVNTPAGAEADTADSMLLLNPHQFGGGPVYPNLATDLSGKVMWYYAKKPPQNLILTRPLTNGTLLTIQGGQAWNPASGDKQLLIQVDVAGNIVRETNTGIIQQQLLALGASDGGPCNVFPTPAPVGSACLDDFHHDAIQTLPNGDTAVLTSIEKIYPAGTQGSASTLPVDIIGDMIVVLDENWQVKWYFDAFEHATGAPQLDITRPAVLGGTCAQGQDGCPYGFLLGTGIAPLALDWLHANTIYYWPHDQLGNAGQIIWSSKGQDWVMKVDYRNGAGTGDILWRMGRQGDFTFNNFNSDPWPWFSGQHEVAMENNGAGPLSVFDNGNTRTSKAPLGLGSNCGPSDCHSRGMALNVDEIGMQVTPVLSVDLGLTAFSGGNAQLLANGNYYFNAATVLISISTEDSFALEILPTAGTLTGTQVLNVATTESYRGWQLSSLYSPPIT